MYGDSLQWLIATQWFTYIEITEGLAGKVLGFRLIEPVAEEFDALEAELKEVRAEKDSEQVDLQENVEYVIDPRSARCAFVLSFVRRDLLDEHVQRDKVIAEKFAGHAAAQLKHLSEHRRLPVLRVRLPACIVDVHVDRIDDVGD